MATESGGTVTIREEALQGLIHTVRGMQVMLDSDLAGLYGVEIRYLNQQVKRNIERFPDEFCFRLTAEERESLRSQNVILDDEEVSKDISSNEGSLRSQNVILKKNGSRRGRHRKYLPRVFTEQGVAMLSGVLRSQTAIQTSIDIMNAFVSMRRFIENNGLVLQRLGSLEMRQITHERATEERFGRVFDALEAGNHKPAQGIFFDGQMFDAYVFINDLLRKARKSIVLIDNFVDDSVLKQLAKRGEEVSALILTKNISETLKQDVRKHNDQYPPVEVREFADSHDRFLIIDGETVYHIGASLKDSGKKWFAFSEMHRDGLKVMEKLKEILADDFIRDKEPMSGHGSGDAGGPASLPPPPVPGS